MSTSELSALALEKLTRVLGTSKGRKTFDETLAAAQLMAIRTPDDLYAFSEALSRRPGFESALGAMLGVTAVLRGAAGKKRA